MGYNKFIFMNLCMKIYNEGGFDSNKIYIKFMIKALKCVHIARHSYYKIR